MNCYLRKKYTLIVFSSILSILFFLSYAGASEVTDQISTTIEKVLYILKDKTVGGAAKSAERRAMLQVVIEERFSFEEMSRRSLARHWRKISDVEKGEFVAIFADLLANAYIKKIESYSDEKILYISERKDKGRAVVKTIIISKGKDIPIHYRLINKDKHNWLVYDIVIEGVSLVSNYRSQFNSIIRRSSYEELVKQLKKKVE